MKKKKKKGMAGAYGRDYGTKVSGLAKSGSVRGRVLKRKKKTAKKTAKKSRR